MAINVNNMTHIGVGSRYAKKKKSTQVATNSTQNFLENSVDTIESIDTSYHGPGCFADIDD